MSDSFGTKFKQALASASDAAKQKASALMTTAKTLAAGGAAAVKKGVLATLESNLASTAVVTGVGLIPGGAPAAIALKGVKAGYDYALKGDKDYEAADPYLNGELKDSAQVNCGGKVGLEKARRRREREHLVAAGKASPDPKKQEAATRLENDMVGVERARLSKHVYDRYDPSKADKAGKPPAPPTGFLYPSEDELDGLKITEDMLAPEGSTFRAELYKVDPAVGPTPPEYVMAYRGTEETADWTKANLPQGLGLETDHYNRAMALGRKLANSGKAAEFTGHSLGGGLASAAAVVTGLPASTQNSAGLHGNTTERQGKALDKAAAMKNVTAYRINGIEKTEILTSLSKLPGVPDAIGSPRDLEVPKNGVSRLGLHSVDAVIDSIEDQKQADQQTLDPR